MSGEELLSVALAIVDCFMAEESDELVAAGTVLECVEKRAPGAVEPAKRCLADWDESRGADVRELRVSIYYAAVCVALALNDSVGVAGRGEPGLR